MIDSFDYSGTLGQLHQNYRHKKLNKILSKHLQNIRLVYKINDSMKTARKIKKLSLALLKNGGYYYHKSLLLI